MKTVLPFFSVIRADGDDRHNFLHNQLSNDINRLAPNQACYATYNTPQGRVIANMLVWNNSESLFIALAADLMETVLKRLRMFVLRAKVKLDTAEGWCVSGSLPAQAAILRPQSPVFSFPADSNGTISLPHGGHIRIAPRPEQPDCLPEAETAFNTHEILCGYPWISAATSETCVAQMLNQHQIGAVHFRKGCYPGQEIIARAQYRGQVKRGLALAQSSQPLQAGDKIINTQQEEVGIIINASGCLNLSVIKHSAVHTPLQSIKNQPLILQHLFFSTEEDA